MQVDVLIVLYKFQGSTQSRLFFFFYLKGEGHQDDGGEGRRAQ